MAKLKCDLHQRRVQAINGRFLHRGGWGEVCPTKTATIGGVQYTALEIKDREGKRTERLEET